MNVISACRPATATLTVLIASAVASCSQAESKLDHPATVAEAVQRADFEKFALMDGADANSVRKRSHLTTRVPATVTAAHDFYKKQLLALQWQEQPGSSVTDAYASSTYTRDGFNVSLMVMPSGSGADVILRHHGNVDLGKLPLPAGTTPVYVGPMSAMHNATGTVEAVAAECRKLFTAAGWEPYGTAGDTQNFRQNAVLVGATISAAPAQGGKTMISYQAQLLAAEIPLMPGAEKVQWAETLSTLDFEVAATEEEVNAHYRKALAAAGWQATLENLLAMEDKNIVIFRNPAKECLTLELKKSIEGKARVALVFQSAAEFEAQEKRLDEQAEKFKRQRAGQ